MFKGTDRLLDGMMSPEALAEYERQHPHLRIKEPKTLPRWPVSGWADELLDGLDVPDPPPPTERKNPY